MISDLSLNPTDAAPQRDLLFTIPDDDLDLFGGLLPRARDQVRRRLKAMRRIHRAVADGKSARSECLVIAAALGHERGWSLDRLQALWREFATTGNWTVLVDSALAGPAWYQSLDTRALPAAFLDHLASKWAMRQRDKFAAVFGEISMQLHRWRAGDRSAAIPGYASCPPPAPGSTDDLPAGWTYGNLLRAVKPRVSRYARRLVQIGPKHAAQLGPEILSTRLGLAPGQYYVFDDSWNDFKVVSYRQSVRLLAFHALDLPSGCNVMRGYKPALRDEREIEERLREQEMIWLIVKLLTTEGYRREGTTFICERGTATVREREEALLHDLLGGAIKVERGPRGGGPGIAGLYTDQRMVNGRLTGIPGGNPRWKAPLESWFNLLRNRTDNLLEFPGQTGSNSRINMPEGLPGTERDTLALIKAARALPPEKADALRLGLLSANEAIFKLDAVTEVINWRTDHNLEGWRECGHFVHEWRPSPQSRWQPEAALLDYDPAERAAIAAFIAHAQSCKRERALSPREVFDAGKSSLVKIPPVVAAMLLAELPGTERPVQQGCIEISCADIDPDHPLHYGPMIRDGRGTREPLRPQDKYLVRLNPLDPRVAWLYSADGKFAGVADYYDRVHRPDTHALHAAFGEKRKAVAPLIAEARRLAEPLTQAGIERMEHNTAVFGPRPGAAQCPDTARSRALRGFEGDVSDLVAPAGEPEKNLADAPQPASAAESAEADLSAEGLL